jgi:transposase, IS5 family
MSRRCFTQPSLADAFVKAYSKAGGFLEDLQKTVEWSAFDVLLAQINANTKGAPGYPRRRARGLQTARHRDDGLRR